MSGAWGVWLADQDWDRTLSKGIYTYARLFAREAIRRRPERGTLVVNTGCAGDMVPPDAAADVIRLPRAIAHGPLRLLGDQIVAPAVAALRSLLVLHFPKGFVPAWSPARTRVTATLHDAIPLHYEQHYPGFFPPVKLAYLRRAMVVTLRRAHAVTTDSRHSADELLRLAAEAGLPRPRLEVLPLTPDPDLTDAPWTGERSPGVLVHFGSTLPHKRTRDMIMTFRALNERRGRRFELHVVGLDALPPAWAMTVSDDVRLRGRLGREALRQVLGSAAALLLPSDVEGFGLPALEAWFLGTPVCHSGTASLGELLAGLPGVFDVTSPDQLGAALDDVLGLGGDERATISSGLRQRYGAETFGRRCAQLLGDWMR